eukprot:2242022-Rhodomonas_salina.1
MQAAACASACASTGLLALLRDVGAEPRELQQLFYPHDVTGPLHCVTDSGRCVSQRICGKGQWVVTCCL